MLDLAWQGYVAGARMWIGVPCTLGACALGILLCGVARTASRAGRVYLARSLAWAGTCVAVVSLSCALWANARQAESQALAFASTPASFRVVSDASMGTFGISCTAEALDGQGKRLALIRLTSDEAYGRGDAISCVARSEPLDKSAWARTRFMKGEVGSAQVMYVKGVKRAPDGIIGALRQAALDRIRPELSDGRALVAGTICGYTTELNESAVSDTFSATGLSHLVAVSGSHLALVSSLIARALARSSLSVGARYAAMGAIGVAYVLFTGCAPSAVRSAAMSCLAMAAQTGRRRSHSLSALSLSVMGFAIASPGAVYDMGFQLSAASVLFIGLFFPYLACLLRRLGVPAAISEALSLTLVAQWATLPLTLPVFSRLSLVAPVANLVVGPIMSALLTCGLVVTGAAVLLPPLTFMMAVPEGIANVAIFCADLLSGMPLASIPISSPPWLPFAAYGIAAAVFILWPDPGRGPLVGGIVGAGMAVAAWLAYWLLFAPPTVTVLDVGQADAILIREGSQTVLMDAGVDDAVVDALARNHVLDIDAVIISHWDRDHWGGLPDVLRAVHVGQVYCAKGAAAGVPDELEGLLSSPPRELACGDTVRVGGFTCEVVWPEGLWRGRRTGTPWRFPSIMVRRCPCCLPATPRPTRSESMLAGWRTSMC